MSDVLDTLLDTLRDLRQQLGEARREQAALREAATTAAARLAEHTEELEGLGERMSSLEARAKVAEVERAERRGAWRAYAAIGGAGAIIGGGAGKVIDTVIRLFEGGAPK